MFPAAILLAVLTAQKLPTPEERQTVVAVVRLEIQITLDQLLDELIAQYGELQAQELMAGHMVEMEMEARDLKVRDSEIEAYLPRFLQQRQWTKGLDELLKTTGMSREALKAKLRLAVAMEKMAKMDQKLPPDQDLNPILLQFWGQELRKKFTMESDRSKLPAGILGRVMGPKRGADVTREDVLAALYPSLKLRHLEEALKPLAEYAAIKDELARRGAKVDEEAVAGRVAAERRKYEGTFIPWEMLLRILGKTVAGERRRYWYENGVKQVYGFAPKEEDLKKHYQSDPDLFCGATVELSHILVMEQGGSGIDWEKSEKMAREVREKVKKPEDFAAVCKEASKDPTSKDKGGDLGAVAKRGTAVIPSGLTRAAFAAKENEIGGPVKSERGWHVFLVRKKNPPKPEEFPYEKVRSDVTADYEDEVLKKKWLKEHQEEAKKYYQENLDHYGRATVEANHILCAVVDQKSGKVDYDKSLAKAQDALTKIKAGMDFSAAAKDFSDDPETKDKGGDIGLFPIKGRIAHDFSRAAFAMKEGDVSAPVKTKQGWHLIKVRRRGQPNLKDYPFEAVQDLVATEYWEDQCRKFIDDFMAKAKIEYRLDSLKKFALSD
jgi:parvulin-like peptidyl-prolyl isomerase